MRRFAISLLCALFMVACGRTESKLTPVDDCEECTCEGMVPAVHEHPDALPVEVDEATGVYTLLGSLDVDTCADPSLAGTEDIDFGDWILAATSAAYLFMQGDFILTSPVDDRLVYTFSYASGEGESWFCEQEAGDFVVTLSNFTETGLDAQFELYQHDTQCWMGNDENDEPIFEDFTCERLWTAVGTRVVVE